MYPVRNDWVHQVREDLADFNLEVDLDQLTKMSKNVFKKMVKKKLKEYSLEYLTTIKEKHSKMDQLVYPKLKIQNYLKDRKISVQAAKSLFRWRTRSALFKINFGISYLNTACPYYHTDTDSQEHSLQCTIGKHKFEVRVTYSDILDQDIPSDISETVMKITKLREEICL